MRDCDCLDCRCVTSSATCTPSQSTRENYDRFVIICSGEVLSWDVPSKEITNEIESLISQGIIFAEDVEYLEVYKKVNRQYKLSVKVVEG